MASIQEWINGARPRTLPAALAPVLVGSGAAAAIGKAHLGRAGLALIVALGLQVAVNYANDYSDGVRGTDNNRVGPLRLTASGLAQPNAVKKAALLSGGIAAMAGVGLVAWSEQWWLLLVGALSALAAWGYTGGTRPYGYRGWGEVAVFLFFGVVAVLGTTYTQAGRVSWVAGAGAVGVGAFACAILVANNLRDIPTDTVAGKNTLAVRLGDHRTRQLYLTLITIAFVVIAAITVRVPWAVVAFSAVGLVIRPVQVIRSGATGSALILVLRDTARTQLVYAIGLAMALAW
ncbi:MAG: 1,4-dihydroxy-2-naphthoate polyprenyltransferase [Actinomycetota bacterium]